MRVNNDEFVDERLFKAQDSVILSAAYAKFIYAFFARSRKK